MIMKYIRVALFCTAVFGSPGFPLRLLAQDSGVPLQAPAYHLLDRLDIASGVKGAIHPELKYFSRKDVAGYARLADSLGQGLSARDRADLQYLFDDNNEWVEAPRQNRRPLLRAFFKTPANLFEVNNPHFILRANAMFNGSVGREKDTDELLFANQRGLEVRGSVDHKVFFYTSFLETQARYPAYVNQRIDAYAALPGAGSFKDFRSDLFRVSKGYDFGLATAYVGFQATRHIGVQLGHGRHFIGNGYRSLFLSDFGNNAFFLKINTRVWHLHYQNLFLELSPISQRLQTTSELLPKKYAVAHYLNYRIRPNLAFGFFEATVLNRSRQFELQYLNPVILYRSVEALLGSPDNVLIGLDGRWNFLQRFQLYGQLMIDEFLVSALYRPEEKGWWGNKFGFQAGLKYINAFGVDHLDVQLELNSVRPYTYSHLDSLNSYTHYNQPLAHPLWANFREFVGIVRYQPWPRLLATARYLHAQTGENSATQNWGANPLLDYDSRTADYGNFIGQGVAASIDLLGLDVSWQVYHNTYLDFKLLLRRKNSADDTRDLDTRLWGFGLRMNVWEQRMDF